MRTTKTEIRSEEIVVPEKLKIENSISIDCRKPGKIFFAVNDARRMSSRMVLYGFGLKKRNPYRLISAGAASSARQLMLDIAARSSLA